MKYFAESLQRLARERGVSNAELARQCGIEVRTFANYCSGLREPDLDTLVRICLQTGVTPNDLLLDTEGESLRRGKLVARLAAALEAVPDTDVAAVTAAMEALAAHRREVSR